ncbi:FadR/GntR family transcriptional regulator [Aureimonas sp. AU22]|uniref:FadR/GntR family transcriptional regulator n=1 Tax=Aureimonas sp. AU22 TaxID=1638162 RepID=UPI000706AE2B|nr:FadR/GntR family transcriptional regulator [Aureimonas sp. AU22]BAT29867.1 pyruvate dehydrogenase complex repressor [Aureimonas sp. AU22]
MDRQEKSVPKARGKLAEQIVAAFEERILAGNMAVGERMPSEAEIAREFSVSSRPVREAMQILATKGLIRLRHGEKATVARDDVDEYLGTLATSIRRSLSRDPAYLTELMVVRRMIESDVIDLLVVRTDADYRPVEAALEEMRAAGECKDFLRFADADAAFHRALVNAGGNGILSVFYDNVFGLVTEVIRLTSSVPTKSYEDAYAEHAAIYDAIRSGDSEKAKRAMRAHIDNSSEYLQVAIRSKK